MILKIWKQLLRNLNGFIKYQLMISLDKHILGISVFLTKMFTILTCFNKFILMFIYI